jgi:hypothetical protein
MERRLETPERVIRLALGRPFEVCVFYRSHMDLMFAEGPYFPRFPG